LSYLLLIAGLAVLIVSGELLVKGAVGIALKFRISTLVIGMTIVSFGTSAPELLVSLKAALEGHPDIAIGNVIGSNIANLALVLGLTTLILPLNIERNSLVIDWPFMMGGTALFYLFILNGMLEHWEGAVMLGALIVFSVWLIHKSRKDGKAEEAVSEEVQEERKKPSSIWRDTAFVVLACAGLFFGARWLLDGAVEIARSFDVSDHFIAVTVVAFGTSAPELITSLTAAFRKQGDISVGNLIGSNLFNVLGILGITAMVQEIPVSDVVLNNDIFWVLAISFVLLPFMLTGMKIGRIKGVMLFGSYLAYIFFQL